MSKARNLLGIAAGIALLAILVVAWQVLLAPAPTAALPGAMTRARSTDEGDAPATLASRGAAAVELEAASAREAAAVAALPAIAPSDEPVVLPGTISGRVFSPVPSHPVAGARVRLVLERGETFAQLATLTTDGEGRYATVAPELAALSSIQRSTARVVAYASAEKFSAVSDSRYVVDEHNRMLELDVRLTPGRSVRGRVVDANGVPVAHARVQNTVTFFAAAQQTCDEDGNFCIALAGHQRGSILWARDAGLGCARVEVSPDEHATSLDVGDVVLRDFGQLAGRVVDLRSVPIAGLRIAAARQQEPEPPPIHDQVAALNGRADFVRYEEDGFGGLRMAPMGAFEGVDSGAASTDTRGYFRIVGLRGGSYAMFAPSPDRDEFPKRSLSDARGNGVFEIGSRNLELVAPGAWLVVQIVDDAGAPLPGIELAYSPTGEGDVIELHSPPLAAWRWLTLDSADARIAFPVGCRRIALYAEADDATAGEQVVEVPESGVVHALLRLAPIAAHARMRARITYPDGSECRDYTLALGSSDTGKELASFSWFDTDAEGWSPKLPTGAYDYEISLSTAEVSRHPYCVPIRGRGLVLAPDAELHFEAAFELGGCLSVTAESSHDDESRLLGRAELFDGSGRSVTLTCAPDPRRSKREIESGGLLLGRSEVFLEILPAGRYTLRVTAIGCEPMESAIVIAPGETTNVEVELTIDS